MSFLSSKCNDKFMIENIKHYQNRYSGYLSYFPKPVHKTMTRELIRLENAINNEKNGLARNTMNEIFQRYVISSAILGDSGFNLNVDEIRYIMDEEIENQKISRTLVDG
jgi:hypothetical protein